MLPLPVMESFDRALLELPAVLAAPVHEQSAGAASWLGEAAALAERYRLPLAAELALVKTDLIAFRPGREEGAGDRRRLLQRHAADCLGRAKAAIDASFARQRDLCAQGAELCLQIAAAARARGLIDRTDSVETALEKLRADEALLPALTQVVGAVGAANTTILLDRALAQV